MAVSLQKIRTDPATKDWFRSVGKQKDQYQGVWIVSPADKVHTTIGYRISSVDGSRFFNDARDVNGSMVSTYQSPYANVAYTMHPGLIWKAEYNFFGYG